MADTNKDVQKVLNAIECLTLYRVLFDDPVLGCFKRLLHLDGKRDPTAAGLYYELIGSLLELNQIRNSGRINIFRNYMLDLISCTENIFSRMSEKYAYGEIDPLIIRAAKNDLRLLKVIYDFDLIGYGEYLTHIRDISDFAPDLESLVIRQSNGDSYPDYYFQKRIRFKEIMISSTDWSDNIIGLYNFYHETGSGSFGRFWTFKWESSGSIPQLRGIADPDSIRIDDLVGYEDQKEEILRNTKQFVRGLSANNMLLYGDRGTGKSSTVKSLIHIFGAEGLRIIEVSKHDLKSIHLIISEIEGRAQKFIIFIDDLSFEEDETEYKDLKALLEGSIARPPDNVLVYATSNRRNLVREYFSDREPDEVGRQDTYQEKLSLADRFGIKLVYSAPDKKEFLHTVDELAAKSGITINRPELHELALRWVLWHNARSGRTAKQFIDDLKGKLGLNPDDPNGYKDFNYS